MSLQSLIDSPKELLELIDSCLKPKQKEKKENGEVFTPMKLINEMLDKLPVDVWNNKNLTWLDPCCGMGNFPVAVYLRLMERLKTQIPSDEYRKKHIIENMLYMSELNKKNVFICRQLFNMNNEYKMNIYEGDSLKVDYNKEFGIAQFDIIIGNPPYNAPGTKSTGNTIWQLFVNNSIKLLKHNGYICFIHPNGWRKPNTERGKFYGLFEKMTKDNIILYLEIHDTKDGMKQFNCGTRYDWYILQKTKNENHKTKILDQNNISYEINLNKYNWLANCELELIDKLIATENEEKCKILYSRNNYGADKKWISKTETTEFKYPVVHSTPKERPRFVWSNKNDNGFFGISKVIFGDGGINNPMIDIDGKYAMSQHAMAIIIDNIEEGKKLSNVLSSTIFTKIIRACLWSSFAIEWGMFKDFKQHFYEILLDEERKIEHPIIENEVVIEEVKPKMKRLIIVKPKKKLLIVEDDETA
jgi:16S rRNA G966 N2-methylase RsmD